MSLGSVSGFYPGGRPSGLPENIIEQLVNAKKKEQLDPLQNELQGVQQKKDVYSKLDSTLVKMVQAAEDLNDANSFQVHSASSSDTDVVTANAVSDTAEGSYSVDVSQLAQAHNHVIGTNGDDNPDSTVSGGISDPDDSSLINADMQFSFHHRGNEYSYSTDSDTTLSSLAQKISDESNDVSANVSNMGTDDNPQYVMTLKSITTGAGENRITKDSGDPGVDITGSNTLFSTGDADQEETQVGQNAKFSVDGVSYERTNNTVTNVIDGVTFSLQGQGTGVDVTVSQDVESVTKKVQSFVDTYNQTSGFIESNSNYNQDENQAGPLMGSSVARSAESQMSRTLMEPISGTTGEPYQYLNQVGFEFQRDGSVDFDATKFKSAIQDNPQAVQNLFVGDTGAAGKMENVLKSGFTNSTDGAVTNRIDSIENQIDRLNDRIEREEQDILNYRDRQVDKFSAMEQAISKYQNIESQLSNWLDLGKDDKA